MVVKIPVRCRFFCIACRLNLPFNIILRRRAFLTIGAVRGEGGGGRYWRKQTEACKSRIVPMYPLQAHQFVLIHSLNIVQVEVLEFHQVVVVIDIDQVIVVVIVPRQLR